MIDRAKVEHGARLAAETRGGRCRLVLPETQGDYETPQVWCGDRMVAECQAVEIAVFIAHWNPEFAAELVQELERLWRVEEAMRWIAANCAEPHAQAIADDALANPAATEGLSEDEFRERFKGDMRGFNFANPAAVEALREGIARRMEGR